MTFHYSIIQVRVYGLFAAISRNGKQTHTRGAMLWVREDPAALPGLTRQNNGNCDFSHKPGQLCLVPSADKG